MGGEVPKGIVAQSLQGAIGARQVKCGHKLGDTLRRSANGHAQQARASRERRAEQAGGARLVANLRSGEKLEEFEPGEVRRILVGHYEMRCEIVESAIYVLRLRHTWVEAHGFVPQHAAQVAQEG